MAGLHMAAPTPHTVFRLAVVAGFAVALGLAAYVAHEGLPRPYGGSRQVASPRSGAAGPALRGDGVRVGGGLRGRLGDVADLVHAWSGAGVGRRRPQSWCVSGHAESEDARADPGGSRGRLPLSRRRRWRSGRATAAGRWRRSQGRPRSPRQINILLTIDTLRADAISAVGTRSGQRTTAIDGLAADGVVFTHAVSPAPWTLPAVASILSGLSPSVHLTTELGSRLSDKVTTLARGVWPASATTRRRSSTTRC